MIQDDLIDDFLGDSNKEIWKLIIENRIKDLLNLVRPTVLKGLKVWSFFSNKKKEESPLPVILFELFTNTQSKTLNQQTFGVMEFGKDELFKDLSRLLFALKLNGKYSDLQKIVEDKIHGSCNNITNEIRQKSNGYPNNAMNAQVWVFGSKMRTAFSYLAYFYEKISNVDIQLAMQNCKTSITLSIMPHYKNLVGPDMIKAAQLREQLNLKDEAFGHYEAVVADFENELELFVSDSNEVAYEEEQSILVSLKAAYEGLDRIKGTNSNSENIEIINGILGRQNFPHD